jgi:hypothetical protein
MNQLLDGNNLTQLPIRIFILASKKTLNQTRVSHKCNVMALAPLWCVVSSLGTISMPRMRNRWRADFSLSGLSRQSFGIEIANRNGLIQHLCWLHATFAHVVYGFE